MASSGPGSTLRCGMRGSCLVVVLWGRAAVLASCSVLLTPTPVADALVHRRAAPHGKRRVSRTPEGTSSEERPQPAGGMIMVNERCAAIRSAEGARGVGATRSFRVLFLEVCACLGCGRWRGDLVWWFISVYLDKSWKICFAYFLCVFQWRQARVGWLRYCRLLFYMTCALGGSGWLGLVLGLCGERQRELNVSHRRIRPRI